MAQVTLTASERQAVDSIASKLLSTYGFRTDVFSFAWSDQVDAPTSPSYESLAVSSGDVSINGVGYAWPAADGGAGDYLATDGSGGLSWVSPGSGTIWQQALGVISPVTPTDNLALGGAAGTEKLHVTGNATVSGTVSASTFSGIGSDLKVGYLPGASYTTVQDMQNYFHSSGWISGGVITDNGDGTVAVTGGSGAIRVTNDPLAVIKFFDWAGVNPLAMVDEENNWIYVDYNAGSPVIATSVSAPADYQTKVNIGVVFRRGLELYLNPVYKDTVGDHGKLMVLLHRETMPFAHVSGAIISEVGVRNIALTAGAFWHGLTRYTTPAFDSSGADSFDLYRRVGGSWAEDEVTQIPNDVYDDGSGTLAPLPPGTYGVFWVYQLVNGHVEVVPGQAAYDLSNALKAQPLDTLPHQMVTSGRLVGKVVIQQGASTFEDLHSPFVESFGSITYHGSLDGLSDDDHPQYPLSAGRSGGQSITGGTAASDSLTLNSSSGGTTGFVLIAPSGEKVGVGDLTPAAQFTVGSGSPFRVSSTGDLTRVNDIPYTWPSVQGAADSLLQDDGSGGLTWVGLGSISHNSLGSLTTGDAHTQYALLAGRSGGQILYGGTAASNDLVLNSTSHATKGSISLGGFWAVDPNGEFLPLGTTNTRSIGDDTHRVKDIFLGPGSVHIGTSTSDEAVLTYNTTSNTLEITGTTGDFSVSGAITAGSSIEASLISVTMLDTGAGDEAFAASNTLTVTTINDGLGGYFECMIDSNGVSSNSNEGVVSRAGFYSGNGTIQFARGLRGDVFASAGTTITYGAQLYALKAQGGGTITHLSGISLEDANTDITTTYNKGINIDRREQGTNNASIFISPGGIEDTFTGNWGIYDASTYNSTLFGDLWLQNSDNSASELRLYEPSSSGSNYTAFKAQAQTGSVTYVLPAADATVSGQVLTSDAAGGLTWTTPAAISGLTAGRVPVAASATTLTDSDNLTSSGGSLVIGQNIRLYWDGSFARIGTNTNQDLNLMTNGSSRASLSADGTSFAFSPLIRAQAGLKIESAVGITTDQATVPVLNATATTINFGGAATTISVGASTGTTTVNNNLTVGNDKKISVGFTDSTGTPGPTVTINKPSGYSSIASGASSVVITNSLVSTGSVVWAVIDQSADDTTLTHITRVQTASGSFTINGNLAATADVKVKWAILN